MTKLEIYQKHLTAHPKSLIEGLDYEELVHISMETALSAMEEYGEICFHAGRENVNVKFEYGTTPQPKFKDFKHYKES